MDTFFSVLKGNKKAPSEEEASYSIVITVLTRLIGGVISF